MTFGTVNESTHDLSLKVAYGNEIRRATFNGAPSFDGLRDLVAQLFKLEQAVTVLKYQDEDGDKITMSSDGELREAINLARGKDPLRLFVEAHVLAAPAASVHVNGDTPPTGNEQTSRVYGQGPFEGPFEGPWGFKSHGHPHSGPHSGHHSGHFGPHRGGHYHAGPYHHFGPYGSGNVESQDGRSPYFGRGAFAPAGANPACYKEQKVALKQQIKLMKANATTPDDWQAIKDMKKQMKAECKKGKWNKKHHAKEAKEWKKGNRFVAKHVADVTIPDNSELPAASPVIKTWRLKNIGMTAWPVDSQLIFISKRGDTLKGPEQVPVGAVQPQQEIEISVPFTTPAQPGRYIAYYRMADGAGDKFGQRVWVSFFVPHGPTVQVPSTSFANFTSPPANFTSPPANFTSPPANFATVNRDVAMD